VRVYLAVALILIMGMALRVRDLTSCINGDEGESALNALTILQTGLPRGEYLGLPIYENSLIEPWPEHPEYEFRDSSYSAKGLAIYHGWLPLYAMAGSMKAFGVTADAPAEDLLVRHSDAEIRTRVIAARLPSLVFSATFLLLLFLAGREMFGADAGLAALTAGAIGLPLVSMGYEARYYSATMALTTACCWGIWRMYKYGRWVDYLVIAGLLTLLFYTHLLAFFITGGVFAAAAGSAMRRYGRDQLIKGAVAGAAVAVVVAPWLLLSGFLSQRAHLPPARDFLSFPADLFYYPIKRAPFLLFPLAGVIWLAIVLLFHHRLPRAATRPLERHHRQIVFLLAWIGFGLLAFTLLIPAASYFYKRMTLAVIGPGIVWGAIILAAAARSIHRRYSLIIAPALFAAIVVAGDMAYVPWSRTPPPTRAYDAIARLRQLELQPDTKIYCTPNDQLALVYLTGLPVQSIAPVRKGFLDRYAGPVLIIDSAYPFEPLLPRKIAEIARRQGESLSNQQAQQLRMPITAQLTRNVLVERGVQVELSEPVTLPPIAQDVGRIQREQNAGQLRKFARDGCNNPMVRSFPLRDWGDWWPVFFYRFVDPAARMGENLNYGQRIKTARAEVLPNAWVFYYCPPRPQLVGTREQPK
jgi:MFS family permease